MKTDDIFETFEPTVRETFNFTRDGKIKILIIKNKKDLKFFIEKVKPFWEFEEHNNLKHKYEGFQYKNKMIVWDPDTLLNNINGSTSS